MVGQLLLVCFLVGLTMLLALPAWDDPFAAPRDSQFLWTNLLIGCVSICMILLESSRMPYSLKLMHWLFQYGFFFAAPLVQYLNGSFIWGQLTPNDRQLLHTVNYLILLWQLLWVMCTVPARRIPKDAVHQREHKALGSASPARIAILTALSVVVIAYLHHVSGWNGLLARGARESSNSSTQLALTYAARAVPIVLLATVWLRWRSSKTLGHSLVLLAAVGLALVSNFPTSTTRFWFGAVALGFFVTLFRVRRGVVTYGMLLGLNVIFPLLGQARYATNLRVASNISFGRSFGANLTTGDYDAYSMLAYTYQYVQDAGATAGHQLLTAVLFFVPRSLWPGKGYGSGYTVGQHLGFPFLNVSSPLPAEGLINFGVAGLAIFAVLSAQLANRWDRRYWSGQGWWLRDAYPFMLGFWFFMLRGDLLSSTAFTVGFLSVFLLLSPRQGSMVRGASTPATHRSGESPVGVSGTSAVGTEPASRPAHAGQTRAAGRLRPSTVRGVVSGAYPSR